MGLLLGAALHSPMKGKMMNIINQNSEIRIYVACLASYNNAILYGAWIDANQDEGDIWDAIKDMLAGSSIPNAEEYAIHDYDGFEGVSISEYQGIKSVSEIAKFIEEHGTLGAKLLDYFSDIEEAEQALRERYLGQYESVSDYCEESIIQQCEIPKELEYYIDYERMARDWELTDLLVVELSFDEIHIFSNA